MTSEKLLGEDLLAMQKEKGNICISVIIPTHRISAERRVDKPELKKVMKKAKELLQLKYPETETKPLITAMDEMVETIDFLHNSDGLGIYISPNVKLAVHFPFPVEEKLIVGDNFELRDLLYKVNYSNPYFVLLLTQNVVRFFEGKWNELNEIKDKNFPKEYVEEYEYSSPSRIKSTGGYYHEKSFEKEKSELEAIRFKDFFHHIDETLTDYLVGNTPLIVFGPEKELAWFKNITDHKKQIISEIAGSYNHNGTKELSDLAWPAMLAHFKKEEAELVKEFQEKIGEHLGISGIQDIWSAAKEGKAFKLLVEKDYRSPGFAGNDDYHLYLRPPVEPHKVLADAVDDLIEMVLEKNGQVIFTDNGMLKDFQRIALITRY